MCFLVLLALEKKFLRLIFFLNSNWAWFEWGNWDGAWTTEPIKNNFKVLCCQSDPLKLHHDHYFEGRNPVYRSMEGASGASFWEILCQSLFTLLGSGSCYRLLKTVKSDEIEQNIKSR